MGPRLVSRGKLIQLAFKVWKWALQWGRDLLVAERPVRYDPAKAPAMLQWGRDLLVAESGPWLIERAHIAKLQWGRDLLVAERGPIPIS